MEFEDLLSDIIAFYQIKNSVLRATFYKKYRSIIQLLE